MHLFHGVNFEGVPKAEKAAYKKQKTIKRAFFRGVSETAKQGKALGVVACNHDFAEPEAVSP